MPRVNDKKEFQGTISDFISKNWAVQNIPVFIICNLEKTGYIR